MRAAAAANAATASGARFSGIRRPANTTSGSALARWRVCSDPAYSPSSTIGCAAQPFGAQAAGVQPREAERALGDARAEALDGLPDAPAERAEVFAPVVGAPDLVPVDDQREAPARRASAAASSEK